MSIFGRRQKKISFGGHQFSDEANLEVFDFRRQARQELVKEGISLIRDCILIVFALVLMAVFFIQPVVVEGTSMLPVLHDGERLLVNKVVYYKLKDYSWGHLERGDIVVFWFPREPDRSYVKRIIGLPGETVEIREGKVYINGKLLEEDYIDPAYNRSTASFPPRFVEPYHYFVMGDNRDNSSDSRYWGAVPEKYIYGRAFFRFWQPHGFGFLSKGVYPSDVPLVANEEEDY